jgi:hypothetical protein
VICAGCSTLLAPTWARKSGLCSMTEARRRTLNRLYFVARDGQILQRIAVNLNALLGWVIELRYLHASRQSLFLPSLTALDGAAIEWLTEQARFKTLGAILFTGGDRTSDRGTPVERERLFTRELARDSGGGG